MKQFPIIFSFLYCCFSFVNAQENVTMINDTTYHPFKKIMVIPFEEHMYIGGIQAELAENSGKRHAEIVRFFRYGVASAIQNEFLYTCNTTSLIHYRDTTHDVERTYSKVYYKFEPYMEELSKKDLKTDGKKESKKDNKKEENNKPKAEDSGVKNGQLISVKNVQPKFASLYLKDTSALNYLNNKYGADFFVFITQLDLENDLSDQLALAEQTYKRFARIHYAMVDVKGNFISKGVITTTFPNTVNDLETIQAQYIKELAQKLAEKLPKVSIKVKPIVPPAAADEKIKPVEK